MEESLKDLTLGNLVKSIRINYSPNPRQPDTQKQCGEKMGISRSYLSAIEAGVRVAKDEQLQKLAYAYGRDREDRDYLLRELRKASLRKKEKEMIVAYDSPQTLPLGSRGEFLPVDLQILIKDRARENGVPDIRLADEAGLSMEDFWKVLSGVLPISHKGITNLARCLGEDPESWLIFCGYIPPGLREKLQGVLRGPEQRKKNKAREKERITTALAEVKSILETEVTQLQLDRKQRPKKRPLPPGEKK